MARLDKKQPFSTRHGENTNGIVYRQGGRYFDCAENEISELGEPIEEARTTIASVDQVPSATPLSMAEHNLVLDLAAWARGEFEYPWFEVTKAIQEQHHAVVQNKRDAVDLLVKDGTVPLASARKFE